MKLYILKRPADDVGYDENEGFVVRAEDAKHARRIASKHHCDEHPNVWLYSNRSTCRELKTDGKPGVVIRDFKAG